jgi:hypothetical protein
VSPAGRSRWSDSRSDSRPWQRQSFKHIHTFCFRMLCSLAPLTSGACLVLNCRVVFTFLRAIVCLYVCTSVCMACMYVCLLAVVICACLALSIALARFGTLARARAFKYYAATTMKSWTSRSIIAAPRYGSAAIVCMCGGGHATKVACMRSKDWRCRA